MKPKPLDLYDSEFSEKLIKEIARIQDEGADNIAERVIELIKQHIKSACEVYLKELEKDLKTLEKYDDELLRKGEVEEHFRVMGQIDQIKQCIALFKFTFKER